MSNLTLLSSLNSLYETILTLIRFQELLMVTLKPIEGFSRQFLYFIVGRHNPLFPLLSPLKIVVQNYDVMS